VIGDQTIKNFISEIDDMLVKVDDGLIPSEKILAVYFLVLLAVPKSPDSLALVDK